MDNNVQDKNEPDLLMFYNKFMGKNYIEELKSGNEYKSLCNKLNETCKEIMSNLPEEKKDLLKGLLLEYDNITTAIMAEETKFCYINGFKESLQLIKEMI